MQVGEAAAGTGGVKQPERSDVARAVLDEVACGFAMKAVERVYLLAWRASSIRCRWPLREGDASIDRQGGTKSGSTSQAPETVRRSRNKGS